MPKPSVAGYVKEMLSKEKLAHLAAGVAQNNSTQFTHKMGSSDMTFILGEQELSPMKLQKAYLNALNKYIQDDLHLQVIALSIQNGVVTFTRSVKGVTRDTIKATVTLPAGEINENTLKDVDTEAQRQVRAAMHSLSGPQ